MTDQEFESLKSREEQIWRDKEKLLAEWMILRGQVKREELRREIIRQELKVLEYDSFN